MTSTYMTRFLLATIRPAAKWARAQAPVGPSRSSPAVIAVARIDILRQIHARHWLPGLEVRYMPGLAGRYLPGMEGRYTPGLEGRRLPGLE